MNIEYWRTEIDEIDRELLRLLNRRARLAMKLGVLKTAAGLPCCDPERERAVLGRLQQSNPGPLDQDAVRKLFRRIIRESRRLEANVTLNPERVELLDTRVRKPRVMTTAATPEANSTVPHELRAGEGVLV
jgi:chorismate mutase